MASILFYKGSQPKRTAQAAFTMGALQAAASATSEPPEVTGSASNLKLGALQSAASAYFTQQSASVGIATLSLPAPQLAATATHPVNRTATAALSMPRMLINSSAVTGGGVTTQIPIQFHLENAFINNTGPSPSTEAQIRTRLTKYVTDLNAVLDNSVAFQLVFNSANDVIFHPSTDYPPPFFGSEPLPATFRLDVWVQFAALGQSSGGTNARTAVNAWSAIYLYWCAIWAEADINANTAIPFSTRGAHIDYTYQLRMVLHEWGHCFGLGYGEWYSCKYFTDNSGLEPNFTMLNTVGGGGYFDNRLMTIDDPMIGDTGTGVLGDFLTRTKFGPLSVAMIDSVVKREVAAGCTIQANGSMVFNTCMRLPSNHPTATVQVTVEVLTVDNIPIPNANVHLYRLVDYDRNSGTVPYASAITDLNGLVTIYWPSGPMEANNNNMIMLLATAVGYQNNKRLLSAYDIQASIVFPGGGFNGDWAYRDKETIKLTEVYTPSGFRRFEVHFDERVATQGPSPASQAVIAQRFSRYVDDLNYILAKTTNLQFIYNPSTDCFFHTQAEMEAHWFYNQQETFPADWYFETWVKFHTGITSPAGTNTAAGRQSRGGYGSLGIGVIAIWSNEETDSPALVPSGFYSKSQDYVNQMYYFFHETLHNLGVGNGEYYSVNIINDYTGVEPSLARTNLPTQPVKFGGIFWDARPLPQADVMAIGHTSNDRTTWLNLMRLCPLTSFVIDRTIAGVHYSAYDLSYVNYNAPWNGSNYEVTIEVRDATHNTPIAGATVDMYVSDRYVYNQQNLRSPPFATQITNANGQTNFVWGREANQTIFSPDNMFRGFKVSAPGYVRNADALCAWDLNAGIIMEGGGEVGDWRYPGVLIIRLQPG